MFGADWLANLFLSVFLFGLIFTLASVALGFISGGHVGDGGNAVDVGHAGHVGGLGHAGTGGHTTTVGGHPIHINLPGHHDIDIHVGGHNAEAEHAGHDGPGILNMPTIMAFLTWFGGIGYLLRTSLLLNGYVAAILALVGGVAGGAIMFVLLARVLWPMMTRPLDRADYTLPGTAARVTSGIRAGGVGEIVYNKNGTRFIAGAKSLDSTPIARGAEVVIVSYERGLAYVRDVAAILDGKE
ncbi:MAG TPA: hypothetical protein VLQ48_13710 [Chloroflexia bacterium]|nr:hypothetical protein [Chloroflexia bacterium]